MVDLAFLVSPSLRPGLGSALAYRWLASFPQGALHVFGCGGDALSLGRYHLVPPLELPHVESSPAVFRRVTGGRVAPFGAGFVGATLTLPHIAGLVGDRASLLAPHQVLNRYARGLLEALQLTGVSGTYPGRDLITVGRRTIAMVTFEVTPGGQLILEAILANRRPWGVLTSFLERADPDGHVAAQLLLPEHTTSLEDEIGAALEFEDLAALIRSGFERQFGASFEESGTGDPLIDDSGELPAAAFDADWLGSREGGCRLPRRSMRPSQLGVCEVHLDLEGDNSIRQAIIAGDIIANSAAIEGLERSLGGCPFSSASVAEVVRAAFATPDNFFLGIESAAYLVDLIMAAQCDRRSN